MREGEAAGLRMGDVANLGEGYVLVRGSFNGPLKEDRKGVGKSKKVPAPADAVAVLGLHLKRRKLQGARAEDLVFPYSRPTTKRPGKVRKGRVGPVGGLPPEGDSDQVASGSP